MMRPLKTLLGLSLFAAAASSAFAVPFTYNSSNIPLAITDLSTTSSTLVIGNSSTLNDINVYLDLDHTYDGDLKITLKHVETGTQVVLFNRRGGSGNNIGPITFDDEAANSITTGIAPFTGTFRPEQLLSVFDGESLFGTWLLSISDLANHDQGTLQGWGIRGDASSASGTSSVPDGGTTVAMLGMALGGLGLMRRKL